MTSELSKLLMQLDEINKLYEEDPPKIFFLLLLILSDDPLSDDELENLIENIGHSFHNPGEKAKLEKLMTRIRALRAAARKNSEFHNIVSSRMSSLIQTPAVLEYLRKARNSQQTNYLAK